MPRPQDKSCNGASVILIEPRRLEKHDLGDVLHLPSNDDVSPEGDDVTRNRDVAEFIRGGPGDDLAFVVSEDELVDELVRAELQCRLDDEGTARGGEPPIVLVVNEVVVQDVEPNAHGDAVQVVHEAGDIIIRYHYGDARVGDIHGEHGGGGHFCSDC
jgi:hypothetical protein